MAQTTAKLEFKASVHNTSLDDKVEVDVDTFTSLMDWRLTANSSKAEWAELFAGSGIGIEFILVKVAPEDQKTPSATPGMNGDSKDKKYVYVAFGEEGKDPGQDKWLQLKSSMLLFGQSVQSLLPGKIERFGARNELPWNVKVSVLVGRKKPDIPKVFQKDG